MNMLGQKLEYFFVFPESILVVIFNTISNYKLSQYTLAAFRVNIHKNVVHMR